MYLSKVKDSKEGDKTGVIYTSKFENGESKILMDNIPIPYTVNEIPENVLLRHIMISHEGTLIRVFFNNGEWHISTKNNLDAKDALWGDVNLGDLFIERVGGLENLTRRLNQMNQYLFLMSYPEKHKYVCKVTNKVWHYGTFVAGNLVFTENVSGFEKPRRLFTKEEVKFLLKTMSPEYGQGALAFAKDGKIYKIYSQKYILSEIKKKTSKLDILDSPKSQYVQSLKLKPKQRDALQENLRKKYPQQKNDFKKIDQSVNDYIEHVKFWYNKFFVEGERSFVDKTTYIIIQNLKKSKKKLEREVILEELSTQNYKNFKYLFEDEEEVVEE